MKREKYITEAGMRRRRLRAAYLTALIVLPALLIIALLSAALLYAPLFRVRNIEVRGADYIAEDRIMSLIQGSVPSDSFVKHLAGNRNILVWPAVLGDERLRLLPEAESVRFEKDFFDRRIVVHVKAKKRNGIMCFKKEEAGGCRWFDDRGRIFGRAPQAEGSLILSVSDYSRAGADGAVLEERLLKNLFSVFAAIHAMPVIAREIRIENIDREEVRILTHEGPALLMSLRFPAEGVPAAFEALRNKIDTANLEYIDFRAENRVYYK